MSGIISLVKEFPFNHLEKNAFDEKKYLWLLTNRVKMGSKMGMMLSSTRRKWIILSKLNIFLPGNDRDNATHVTLMFCFLFRLLESLYLVLLLCSPCQDKQAAK